jgi:hypothetical protein
MRKRTLTDDEAKALADLLVIARAAARDGATPGRAWLLADLGHRLDTLPADLLAKVQP